MTPQLPFKRIVCPTDFSEASRAALAHAIGLARWCDAEITIVHAAPIVPLAGIEPAVVGLDGIREPDDVGRPARRPHGVRRASPTRGARRAHRSPRGRAGPRDPRAGRRRIRRPARDGHPGPQRPQPLAAGLGDRERPPPGRLSGRDRIPRRGPRSRERTPLRHGGVPRPTCAAPPRRRWSSALPSLGTRTRSSRCSTSWTRRRVRSSLGAPPGPRYRSRGGRRPQAPRERRPRRLALLAQGLGAGDHRHTRPRDPARRAGAPRGPHRDGRPRPEPDRRPVLRINGAQRGARRPVPGAHAAPGRRREEGARQSRTRATRSCRCAEGVSRGGEGPARLVILFELVLDLPRADLKHAAARDVLPSIDSRVRRIASRSISARVLPGIRSREAARRRRRRAAPVAAWGSRPAGGSARRRAPRPAPWRSPARGRSPARVREEHRRAPRGDALRRALPFALGVAPQEVVGQDGDVPAALAQRRDVDRQRR